MSHHRRNIKMSMIAAACFAVLNGCASQPDEFKQLYNKGLTELMVHNYATAEPLFQQAINYAEKRLSVEKQQAAQAAEHLRLADSLTALGRVYAEQGRFASARGPLERAAREYEAAFGTPEQARVAASLNELAVCYHKQAQYDAAHDTALKALKIREKLLGPNHLLVASTCNNLAEICLRQQHDEEAERYFHRALGIYRQAKSPEATKGLMQTLNNLALYYSANNELEKAHDEVDEAIKLAESKAGKLGPADLAATLLCRAGIERASFDYVEAEKDFKHAIALLKSDRTPRHVQLCEALDTYADLLLDQHRHEDAAPLYKEAIQHCKKAHGLHHPCVAERINDLAELYEKDDKYPEAEKLLLEAFEINKSCFDSDSPIVIKTINDLAQVYVHQKKYAEAQQVYEHWVPELERVLGKNHARVADALDNWAMVAQQAKNQKEAGLLLARAKAVRQAHLPEGNGRGSLPAPAAEPAQQAIKEDAVGKPNRVK